MNRKEDGFHFEEFIIGALFGGALSAIVALLLAPKSGKDLREDIGEETAKTLESTDEYLELAREKGSEVIQDVEDAASSYFNLAGNKVEEAEQMVEDTAEKIEEELVEE